MDADLVLGVAMSSTTVSLVLMRWRDTDELILDRDRIETTPPREGLDAGVLAKRAKNAVLRTYATAAKNRYRIVAVGVTCVGTDTDEAVRLIGPLRERGCRNVGLVGPKTVCSTRTPRSAAALASKYAADMVRDPEEARPLKRSGRHPEPASRSSRRAAVGAAAASVAAGLAAFVVGTMTAPDRPAAESPDVPAANSPTPIEQAPIEQAPGSVVMGIDAEPRQAVPVAPPPTDP